MNDAGPNLVALSLFVRDMAAALAFYRRLGLPVEPGMEHDVHVELATAGGLKLELDTIELTRSYDPAWQAPAGGSRGVMQFLVASREAVDALFAELTGAGYNGHQPPFDAFWGSRYAVVDDPDGNLVALTSVQDPTRHGPMPQL